MISALVITKNEENNIRACLESLQWADELIVVDSYSTDGTVSIAREFTQAIYARKWNGFLSQRNFGISKAEGEWVVILDADERITDELKDEINKWVQSDESSRYAAGFVPRRNFIFGKWLRYGGLYPDLQCRLIRKGRVSYDESSLDTPLIDGRCKIFSHPIEHFTSETVSIRLEKIVRQSSFLAREKLEKRGHARWQDIIGRPIVSFIKSYVLKMGCRDGIEGLVWSGLSSLHNFLCYAKMWQLSWHCESQDHGNAPKGG